MSSSEENYFAKIRHSLIEGRRTGDMTPAMLVTINILDRWADWNTGTVERASGEGISTWCNNTLKKNTVQKALQRLEQQGHVTRDLTLGSHQGYPVVTLNYEAKIRELSRYPDGSIVKGENGQPVCTTRTEVLNPKKVLTWKEVRQGGAVNPPPARPGRRAAR